MRIVIYGLGRIFEHYKEKLNWHHVIALCDKNIEMDRLVCSGYDIPIIHRKALCNFEYDFVVVFSDNFFEEIKRELVGEYSLPKDKIISWREIIWEKRAMPADILSFCRSYFGEKEYRKFLDIGMNYLPQRYLTKTELLLGKDIVLDGILSDAAESNHNLYDNVYKNCYEIEGDYDMAILWDYPQNMKDIFQVLSKRVKNIVFCMRRDETVPLKVMKDKLGEFGDVKCISNVKGDFWIIDTEQKNNVLNRVSIFVATHKKYDLYKERPYLPLCIGGYQEEGYLTERSGENIAYLNPRINECTALYWIWKNTDSKYVGLNHYRRYFYNNEIESMDNYLDLEHMSEIFQEYDIILPKTYPIDQMTMLEQISDSMNPELCQKGYAIVRGKIEKRQPDYLEAFDSVMRGHVIFNCNIFVTRRDILNRYCEWLFSFLIEAAEEIDVEGYDSYSQRVIGFFAERMWTVWLRKNRLRIKELPYVMIR